ncbi:MAG: small-conductance mechanosensitive channel [Candidatus Angelobacter sp.]|nr:small-conductance mechanosensitive channel [Candidatus Angelobacter sp.]
MERLFDHIAALSLIAKLIYSIVGVVLIRSAFHLLERTLPPHFGYGDQRYHVRKMVTAAAYIIIFIFITILFADRLKHVGFAVGVMGAGVVVALQDVIASLGGFIAIGFSNLYRVGDRIQVNETKGDVVDISVMRTTVMETGNWVSGDLYNGRIVRIPNSVVLKGLVFNYSQGFRFVWDEIKIQLTCGSDHQHTREMLLRVAKETVSDYLVEAQRSWKWVTENYRIESPLLEPMVTLQGSGGSLEFSLSYIVDYTKRTTVKDQLFTKIVDEVASSKGRLEWASSSTTVVGKSPVADLLAPGDLASASSATAR